MKPAKIITYILATFFAGTLLAQQAGFPEYEGPYLGLVPPESGAEVFLPRLVSTAQKERCVTFLDSGSVMLFTTDDGGTHYTWLNGKRWTPAQPFPYNYRDDMLDYTAGPDGKSLVFMTSRPIDENDKSDTHHFWTVEWTGNAWGQPVPLPAPKKITGLGGGYPTLGNEGELYFTSDARDGAADGGIFVTDTSPRNTGKAELMPAPINSEHTDFDPYIAPDGRYLIFTSNRPGGVGKFDNYIVFREADGSWSPAFNLGAGLNSAHGECCPNVTPDGKLFFFASWRPSEFLKDDNGNALPTGRDVYWADAGFIKKMEKQNRTSAKSAQ